MPDNDLTSILDAAAARRSAAQSRAAGVTPGQVAGLNDLHETHPSLGLASVPLALQGVPAQSSVARKAAVASVAVEAARKKVGQETTGGKLSRFWGGVKDRVLKPIVRYGTAGAQYPVESVMAGVRTSAAELGLADGQGYTIGDPTQLLRQTTLGAGIAEAHDRGTLGQSLKDVFGHGNSDEELAGGGWFIDPKTSITGKRQAREANIAASVDGHAFTIGRGIASATPLEPGSLGYHIVSGVPDFVATIVLDPLTYVGGNAAKANRVRSVADAGKLVETTVPVRRVEALSGAPKTRAEFDSTEIGLVDATRKTVLPEKFASWLGSDKGGGHVTKALADISPDDPQAFTKVWRGTGKKLPADLVVKLVDATDPVDVQNILIDAVQEGKARELIKFSTKKPPARLAGMMPQKSVDLDDTDDVVEQADRMLRNARIPEDDIGPALLGLARASSKGERYALINGLLDVQKKAYIAAGLTEREAAATVRSFGDAREGNRLYHVDMIADGATVRSLKIEGTDHEIVGPHMSVQLIDRHMPLPDARAMKTAARQWAWVREVQQSAPYTLSADSLDFITQDLFKPLALLPRVAYPIRVIGEEQARMAASDYTSLFKHPLSYIGMLIADKPTATNRTIDTAATEARLLKAREAFAADPSARNKAAVRFASRNNVEITQDVPSVLHSILSKHLNASNLGGDALGGRFEEEDLVKGASAFKQAMSSDGGGWADKVIAGTSRHWSPVRPHEPEFIDGWHRELIQAASDPIVREIARNGPEQTKLLMFNGNLTGLRKELAASLKDSLGRKVDLNNRAVADAYIDSEAKALAKLTQSHPDLMRAVAHANLNGHSLNEGLRPGQGAHAELEKLLADGHHPPVVRAQVVDKTKGSRGARILSSYEDGVQNAFRLMMSTPTNRLSRSKVFKQAYWRRMEETLPLLTKQEQIRAVRAAKEAGVPKAQIASMRAKVAEAEHYGKLTVEQADHVAKAHGLTETRDLLYSLHEKSQVADAFRVIFPFGEAWREVLTRWAKIGSQNPLAPYRATQGLVNGRESGFFYPDPTTGQEMFAIPGSQWITEKFAGVPMKLDAPVGGLNMFGTVMPGVGPAVTYPVSKFLPDTPTTDFVRNTLLPFGDPDTGGGFIESLFPSYWRKLQAGVSSHASERSERQLMSTVRDTAAYLASTGDYDLSTAEGQARLQADAKAKGRALFIIRAIAQGVAPSPPSPHFYAKDKTGALHTLYQLQADYRSMQADPKIGYQHATEAFIEKWGDLAFLSTISRTTGANATTDKVNDLVRAHPAQAEKFPDVIGLFAPGGKVDPGEIERQIQSGQRDVINLPDAVTLSNIRLANARYDQAKAQVGDHPSDVQRRWLWDVQDALVKKYPGYTGTAGDLSKGPGSVQQLVRAAADPVLAATDAGKGLNAYLKAREMAQSAARQAGVKSFTTAKQMQPWRDWLSTVADRILTDHPDFVDMWDRVLSREVED